MRITLLAFSLFLSTNAFASSLWEDVSQPNSNKLSRSSLPSYSARILSLDEPALRQQLLTSPIKTFSNNSLKKAATKNNQLELPLPDGSMVQFVVEEYPLLSKELALKFPNIKAWKVHEANGKNIHGRIDLTATGFHAMLTLEDGDTIFIDPSKSIKNNHQYDSFSKRKNKHLFLRNEVKKEVFVQPFSLQKRSIKPQAKATNASQDLITYRLALAATGEYVALNGGTKSSALSAMATTINRVNEIYERDLSVRLTLVANMEKIIYTDAKTDPFTSGDAYTMLDETIATIDAEIGDANYDIGHLFGGAGTGGLALLSGICRANKVSHKAGGITGSASPYGDSFNIDYVAHEMGHQFGATHTFNSLTQNCGSGNREPDTAVEPGSGSTIMSYAGICGKNNLQNNSDAVFNAVSIAQINNYIRHNEGTICGVHSSSNNTNPTIISPQNFIIPSNTPFVLTSNAYDADGDALSYTWDQIDANGTAVDVDFDTGDSPLFRSYLPSSTNYRYFPHIDTLFGATPIKGEILALTDRELNFAATVRDNRGGIARTDTKIITSGNPFTLTSHTSSYLYNTNDNIDVSWNVAGTDIAPINCQSIDIKLLAKNGTTQNLLLNTPNDGSQNLTIPANINTVSHARLMAACSDNIFFAVSEGYISVNGIDPIITVNAPFIIEGDDESKILNYEVKLTTAKSEDVTINYTIRNNKNNSPIQKGMVRIVAGKTTANIAQVVAGNRVIDGDQHYTLTLLLPNNIQLETIGTVIDNDKNTDESADKQDIPNSDSANKKAAGSMGSILIFLMLYISLLRLRIQAYRSST